jgi:hypothetical protein
MSKPVHIAYEERAVGDLVWFGTRGRVPVPAGWTNLTQNRETNPHVEAYRYVQPGDRDPIRAWGFDPDDTEAFGVMVFRHVSPITTDSVWAGTAAS